MPTQSSINKSRIFTLNKTRMHIVILLGLDDSLKTFVLVVYKGLQAPSIPDASLLVDVVRTAWGL